MLFSLVKFPSTPLARTLSPTHSSTASNAIVFVSVVCAECPVVNMCNGGVVNRFDDGICFLLVVSFLLCVPVCVTDDVVCLKDAASVTDCRGNFIYIYI